jgi:hypothetical protein
MPDYCLRCRSKSCWDCGEFVCDIEWPIILDNKRSAAESAFAKLDSLELGYRRIKAKRMVHKTGQWFYHDKNETNTGKLRPGGQLRRF